MLFQFDEVGRNSWVSCIRVLLYLNGLSSAWEAQSVGDIRIFTSILNQRLRERAEKAWYTSVLKAAYILTMQVNGGTVELHSICT